MDIYRIGGTFILERRNLFFLETLTNSNLLIVNSKIGIFHSANCRRLYALLKTRYA